MVKIPSCLKIPESLSVPFEKLQGNLGRPAQEASLNRVQTAPPASLFKTLLWSASSWGSELFMSLLFAFTATLYEPPFHCPVRWTVDFLFTERHWTWSWFGKGKFSTNPEIELLRSWPLELDQSSDPGSLYSVVVWFGGKLLSHSTLPHL